MKESARIGAVGEQGFVVNQEHTIQFDQEGMPPILSTPSLIWFLEHAARNAMQSLLEPGEITVGVVVHVAHAAATPIGSAVHCRARVIFTDGPLVSFQVEAHDEHEKIAGGTHQRRVVRADRLAQRVMSKSQGQSSK